MQYRQFGRLGWDISAVGFGGAGISGEGGGYGFGHITEADAIDLVRAAQDGGVNLFDTAPFYGYGTSEVRIGKALQGERRLRAYVVSKCGITWDGNKRVQLDNSAATTERMLHQSLRDLQTDYIDLYLVHWPDQKVDIRETMEVLAKAKEAGKIRALGLSNTSLEEIALAREIEEPEGFQAQYNLFERGIEETTLPYAETQKTGFMCWGPLDKGIITGRVVAGRTFDEVDARRRAPWWKNVDHTPRIEAIAALRPEVEGAGHTLLELALGHVLATPAMSTALCGVRNRGQLETALAAVDNLPPADLVAYAQDLTAKVKT